MVAVERYGEALKRLERGYRGLFALVDDFPEAKREQPGAGGDWTPKQVLAHLSGWLIEAAKRYGDFAVGDQTEPTDYDWDHDYAAFNARSVEDRAHLTWDEQVNDLRETWSQFLSRAKKPSAEAVAADDRYEEWLTGLWDDCILHLGQLSAFAMAG